MKDKIMASQLINSLLEAGLPPELTPRSYVPTGKNRPERKAELKVKSAAAEAKRNRKAAKRAALLASGKIVNQVRGSDVQA